jgi:hypothetical protein
MTSSANSAAVSGVPNRAENTADMPHSVASRRSFSSSLNSPADAAAQSAAYLQRRALTACGTAAQMRDNRGDKYDRYQHHRHFSPKCTESMMVFVPWDSIL